MDKILPLAAGGYILLIKSGSSLIVRRKYFNSPPVDRVIVDPKVDAQLWPWLSFGCEKAKKGADTKDAINNPDCMHHCGRVGCFGKCKMAKTIPVDKDYTEKRIVKNKASGKAMEVKRGGDDKDPEAGQEMYLCCKPGKYKSIAPGPPGNFPIVDASTTSEETDVSCKAKKGGSSFLEVAKLTEGNKSLDKQCEEIEEMRLRPRLYAFPLFF